MNIELNRAQINHLLTLLRDAEEEGSYYGNREQYWGRHRAIVQALETSLTTQCPIPKKLYRRSDDTSRTGKE